MAISKATASSIAPAAKGDLVAGTATNDAAVLAVGANDTVLTADSSEATGLKWAAAAGGGANWSLLNAGGTALTGATTITVSGISNKDKIMILVSGASSVNANVSMYWRLNTDTANNYYYYGTQLANPSSYNTTVVANQADNSDKVFLGSLSSNSSSSISGFILLSGCDSAGVKMFNMSASGKSASSTFGSEAFILGGYYNSATTISSISIVSPSANFDAGTVFVYTSA